MFDLVIIGGGAAGFFAGAQLLEKRPDAKVVILEKTGKILSKVRISGGGRCNVSHYCFDNEKLIENYPRGKEWLRPVFRQFAVQETLNWFSWHGAAIIAEPDGRMFPETNDSQTIVDILSQSFKKRNGEIRLNASVSGIQSEPEGFQIFLEKGDPLKTKFVLVASGGSPSGSGFSFLKESGHSFVPPVPSLFTFNVKPHPWADLQGLSVAEARVNLKNSEFVFQGPVLLTHWGFSGPAILKLSAFAARYLNERNYQYVFSVDWLPHFSEKELIEKILEFQMQNLKKRPSQSSVLPIPRRLWEKLVGNVGMDQHFNWAEVGKKKIQALAGLLKHSDFEANGKTTYKEEFVTAGGIKLEEVEPHTCESKIIKGLFFAGEVLDVDGITGGFNFQAAWSTGFVASMTIANRF